MLILKPARILPMMIGGLVLFACDSQRSTGPAGPQFSRTITLPGFNSLLGAGPARVRIWLKPGTLIARRVVVRQGDQLTRDERVDGRVAAITASATADTVTLSTGDLKIVVNGSTTFRGDREEGDDDNPSAPASLAEFTLRLQNALAAGRHPAVEARRPAPGTPQAPTDAAFTAALVRLDDAADRPSIELNVQNANLLTNASPPPDAWLQVLDRKIELRTSDGTTRIGQQTPETLGELQFRGKVASVDVGAQTATLADGTILHLVAGSDIETGDEGDDSTFATLADVKTALAGGDSVVARGEGLRETATPRTLDVIEVRFRKESPDEPEHRGVAFADSVTAADSVAATFTLGNGALVNVTAHTMIAPFGDFHTLGAVVRALAGHQRVKAEGFGMLASMGPPKVLNAIGVEFELNH
ncbi:MAG: hypothetical protein AUG85_00595 [Gemmatimonadetes bacterium 13_1_20CM_4_66_11]|nr:MAG: hypothetical protein AUG85_00595 [Gemmatimonadetes bacterium 13_1_20CM_4_66_11]